LRRYFRSYCREWALHFLYQAEFGGQYQPEAVEQFWRYFQTQGAPPAYLRELAKGMAASRLQPDIKVLILTSLKELVAGVAAHLSELDALIARYSEHWRLERMTLVDRNVLRLAIYELIFQTKIPPKVAINEAVEMAKRYGSEASGAFVNGLLDRIREAVGRKV
jgi:N utilization substance protein B